MSTDPVLVGTPLNGVNIVLCRSLPDGTPWLRWDNVFGPTIFVNEDTYKRLLAEVPIERPEPSEYTLARIMELLAPST